MDVFVCPSCGFNLGEPSEDDYKTKCRNCGKTVAITSHLGTTAKPVPTPKKPTRLRAFPKKVLVISVLATLATGVFVLIARKLTPTTPTQVHKTAYADLNTDEIDNQILSEGITALYYKGWSESETVAYIEHRIADIKAINEVERARYLSSGMRPSELNVKSTESDVRYRSKEEIQKIREEIEARKELIKKFQQILAEHQRTTSSYF